MGIATVLILLITVISILALVSMEIYGGQLPFRKRKPKNMDLEFFKKYITEREREVDEEDRDKIWRYASTGWIQTGLSKNSKLTAKLTKRGRRLLK